MTMLETIAVAFSMFSAIPMPQFLWNEKNMRYALCAFPLIVAVIGAICLGAWSLCGLLGLPNLLRGAILTLIPVLVTGGCVVVCAVVVALANLLTDLAYAFVDPRIMAQYTGGNKRKKAAKEAA